MFEDNGRMCGQTPLGYTPFPQVSVRAIVYPINTSFYVSFHKVKMHQNCSSEGYIFVNVSIVQNPRNNSRTD